MKNVPKNNTEIKKLINSNDIRGKLKYIYSHPDIDLCTVSSESLSTGSSHKIIVKRARTGALWVQYGNSVNELLNTLLNQLKT